MIRKIDTLPSGDRALSFCLDVPEGEHKMIGALFVHAADGNRTGPHRLFVELSELLLQLGLPTMRFDFSGCGDSGGKPSRDNIDQDCDDVRSAAGHFLRLTGIQRVLLIGISRGAEVCFRCTVRGWVPAGGMILLSPPVGSAKASVRLFADSLRQYARKALDPRCVRKIISGRVNLRLITLNLSRSLGLMFRYKKEPVPEKAEPQHDRALALLIFGSSDPIAADSLRHYRTVCDARGLDYEDLVIPNANHSFFHYKWKEQIGRKTVMWLHETGLLDDTQ